MISWSRPRGSRVALISFVLAVGLTASAADDAPEYVRRLKLPIVLSLDGADDAHWSTELVLANAGPSETRVRFRYHAVTGGGDGEVEDVLEPYQQRLVPDAIEYLHELGLPLSGRGRAGSLLATFRGMSEPGDVSLSARVTTPSGAGRAGLSMPGLEHGSGFEYGSTLFSGPVYVVGLREDERTRSNLALFHFGDPGDAPLVLRVTCYSGRPFDAGTAFDVTLPAGGFTQLDSVLKRAGLRSGFASVEPKSGASDFLAYAAVIDRATNDGSLFLARDSLSQLVPVAVDTGTLMTEVALAAFRFSATVRLDWLLSDGHHLLDVPLAQGEQLLIADLGAFFRSKGRSLPPTASGPLFVSNGDVIGAARVLSRTSPGQYGVGFSAGGGPGLGWRTQRVFGLVQDEVRRSNLILSNLGAPPGAEPIRLELEVWNGETGRLAGTGTIVLPTPSTFQLSSVLSTLAPGTKNAWLTLKQTSGDALALALGVVNDGAAPGLRTGDGQPAYAEQSCPPPDPPAATRLSWKGGYAGAREAGAVGCEGPPARSDAAWLRRADLDRRLVAGENDSAEPRATTMIDHFREVPVVQRGRASTSLDGVYVGVTDQGLPIEVVVDLGDVVKLAYSWTAAPLTFNPSCPTAGEVNVIEWKEPVPVDEGVPFSAAGARPRTAELSGTFGAGGALAGNTSVVRCSDGLGLYYREFAVSNQFTARRR